MPNTILIVEDEPNLLAPLQYSLKEEGYATLVATDGENGLRMARTMAPDLIILDVMLPSSTASRFAKSSAASPTSR